jgi:hypothetical protein
MSLSSPMKWTWARPSRSYSSGTPEEGGREGREGGREGGRGGHRRGSFIGAWDDNKL